MSNDQIQCVLAVASTLRQLVQSLRRDPTVVGDGPISVGERNGKITLTECSDFIDLVTSILNDAEGNYSELQTLLLNTDPTLIPTIVSILTIAPAVAVNASSDEVTPFVKLVLSSIQCLLQVVTLGCVDVFQSPQRNRENTDTTSSLTIADPSTVSPEGRRLSEMIGAMLKRTELAHSLTLLLDPASCPAAIARFGAAKLLFTAALRVPSVKSSLAAQQLLLDGLFESAATEDNTKTRSYIVGTLREVAGSHPLEVTHSDENIHSFARIIATDSLSDARAMSAEAVDIIYRNQPQRWAVCGTKKDLSTAIISRLEKEDSSEALAAALRLLETLLIADAALTLGKPMRTSASPSEISFSEHFVNARGERSLIASIRGTNDTDSLAARCFRLLIEFAPFYCEVGYAAARHFPTISVVLKAIVALAADVSDLTNVSDMRFELSVAVALLLSQDPRSRQLLSEELRRNTAWMGRLRGALLSNLNHSTLSDFSGIRIIDVMGNNLSDVRNVAWEEDGQRPVRDSLEAFMIDQYARYIEYQSRGGHSASNGGLASTNFIREVPAADPNGESLETRLTFIILTNTIHNALNANRRQTMPDGSELPNVLTLRGSSADGSVIGKGQLLADLGQADRQVGRGNGSHTNASIPNARPTDLDSLLKHGNDDAIINELSNISSHQSRAHSYLPVTGPVPGQTRTSLIREWKNHPKKLEAIKQMARQAQIEAASVEERRGAEQQDDLRPQPANFAQQAKRIASGNSTNQPGAVLQNTSTQYRNNFVDNLTDPFREPTRDSFKKPRKPTIGQLVAANDTAQQITKPKVYTKFDAALKLCEKLGQHYSPISDAIQQATASAVANNTVVFETTGDGFAKRKISSAPVVKRQPKTWSIDDLREGDLFYFGIPFSTLSAFAVDQVRVQAVRHHNHLKRSYLVVPHHMKGRRWFIFDMSTYVMPQVVAALDDILELMETHGEQNCRFPLLMFKEGEFAKRDQIAQQLLAGSSGSDLQSGDDAVPDATLNSGNLFESLDQLRFYFSKMSEVNPVAATAAAAIPSPSGIRNAAAASLSGNTSQYLIDLEKKINALKSRQFEPRTDAKFMKAFGGTGAAAVIGPSTFEDDEDDMDETTAVPPTTRGLDTNKGPLSPSPSAARARAMLSMDDGDEIQAVEPLGTTARASSRSLPRH